MSARDFPVVNAPAPGADHPLAGADTRASGAVADEGASATATPSQTAVSASAGPATQPACGRPRLLDLFCGAGGGARGYQRAGFYVIGIDEIEQPNYAGDEFFQADALAMQQDCSLGCWHEYSKVSALPGMLARCLGCVEAIHASPPCQGYSDLRHRTGRSYPQLIEMVREILKGSGLPYVIENVEGAPLIDPIMLCGTMFPELRVLRHRLFESNVTLTAPAHGKHPLVFTHDKRKAHHGKLDQDTAFVQVTGGGNCTVANARAAMGIDWMAKDEINEAIPPAYTEHIGSYLMAEVRAKAAA